MTDKAFNDLKIGDFVCDMHHGDDQLHKRFNVVSHVRWGEEPPDVDHIKGPDGYPEHGFDRYISQFRPMVDYGNGRKRPNLAGNKLLYVLGMNQTYGRDVYELVDASVSALCQRRTLSSSPR
jgi:hypothetical protein